MKTAILGAGKMGVWFAKFCREEGDHVVLADRNKEKLEKLRQELGVEAASFEDAVRGADRVMICVSIGAFEEVVEKIAPAIREGQAVMDICSVKAYPVRVMHESIKQGLVLGTHPVFGPGSSSVKHKAFILTPTNAKEQEYAEGFKKWLEREQARVFIMSPERHDELMAVVLGLPHFLGLAACDTLLDQANFSETKKVAGTTYRMLFTLAEVTALETPDLFSSLQMHLPELEKVEELFMAKAQEWFDLVKRKDSAAIAKRMEQLKAKMTKLDSDFAESYELMYRMLEAAEE